MKSRDRLQDLQYRLEYGVVRLVAGIFRSLPLGVATAASAFAWRRLAPIINPKRHQRALDNLAIAFPEKSEAERREIALRHWENLGRVMVETMRIDRFMKEPERIDIVSQNIFSRYKDKLGAAIGVSLHMGNWELAILPFTWAGANPARGLPLGDEPLRRPLSARAAQGPLSRRAVRARQRRRSRRRPEDGARDHGFRAPRRPARPRLRPLRPHRHAGAVLRQGRQDAGDRRHDRAPRRRPHLAVARSSASARRAVSRSSSRSCGCRARRTRRRTSAGP